MQEKSNVSPITLDRLHKSRLKCSSCLKEAWKMAEFRRWSNSPPLSQPNQMHVSKNLLQSTTSSLRSKFELGWNELNVWLHVINLGWPKLYLSSAHEKYSVWPMSEHERAKCCGTYINKGSKDFFTFKSPFTPLWLCCHYHCQTSSFDSAEGHQNMSGSLWKRRYASERSNTPARK